MYCETVYGSARWVMGCQFSSKQLLKTLILFPLLNLNSKMRSETLAP
jgi:hypothetical protein